MRELHWHATAAEWAFVLKGRVRTTVIDPDGSSETNDFDPGDIRYFPRGHGHMLECRGHEPCHFVYEAIDLSQWIAGNPRDVLATHFGRPQATFEKFPREQVFIAPVD
jgi:oxalate decarboxylase